MSHVRPTKSPACTDVAADHSRKSAPPSRISPARVVVVVLPFEPVIATIGPGKNWAASSISPITGSPEPAPAPGAAHPPEPRAHHDQILVPESAFAMSAGFDRDAMIEQHRDLLSQLALRFVSDTVTRAPAPSEIKRKPRPTCRVQRPERACL